MINHEQFKAKYLNTRLDYDGVADYQCADVAKAYADQVWGVRYRAFGLGKTIGGVINAFYNYPDSFIYHDEVELIKNDPSDPNQIPRQGDMPIWDFIPGLTTKFGHIAVVDSADKAGFTSIDQNWGTDQVKLIRHTYKGVLGWLRKRTLNQPINTNLMNKDNLIQSINNNPQFDEETRKLLVQAVMNDDANYLLTFSGSSPRANLKELEAEIAATEAVQKVNEQALRSLENVLAQQQAQPVEKFDSSLLWLGRLKSYLRSNVDLAMFASALTPLVIMLNERYQLGLDNTLITSSILSFAAFLVSVGVIGDKLKK